jgi:hypothetical protein
MKKIIVACLALFFAVSCSTTDSPSTSQDILVKRTVSTDEDGIEETLLYFYNGNKVDRIEGPNGLKVEYTYTGDLITTVRYFVGTMEFQTETFTYNSQGQMIKHLLLALLQDYGAKEEYTYNADGSINYTRAIGDLVSQTESPSTGKYFITNGEITKKESNEFGTTSVVNYTYDTKNNPFKNITGITKISFADQTVGGFNHNLLTEEHPTFPDSNVSTVYQYNSADYPISAVETSSFGESSNLFFYE